MTDEICGYIYEIRNKVNGKGYVGLTTGTVEGRWEFHVYHAERAKDPTGIRAAIRKYSPEAFEVTTLDNALTIRELIDKEVLYIQARGTRAPKGYNLTKGGELPEGTPITVNGIEYRSIKTASLEFEVPYGLICSRLLRNNWTIRQAFGIDPPPILHSHKIELQGKVYKSRAKAAREYGLDPRLVHTRLKAGWSDEEAFGLVPPPTAYEFAGTHYESFADAARVHGLEPYLVHGRLNKGWTVEQAFGLEPKPGSVEIESKVFDTVTDAAKAYGLPVERTLGRLKKGWTLEQALELESPPNDTSVVVQGVTYPTQKDAAKAFGLDRNVVQFRVRSGWTERQAYGVDPPPPLVGHGTKVEVQGRQFPSLSAAARHYGVNEGTAKSRLKLGWAIEQILDIAPKPKRSPPPNAINVELEDIVYPSRASAAEAYGIELSAVEGRLANGWTLEEAFGIVPREDYKGPQAVSVGGLSFPSFRAAAQHFNVRYATARARQRAGWSLEQALELAGRPVKDPVTVGGKTYPSRAAAAHAHGLDPELVGKRMRDLHWSLEEALGIVLRKESVVVKGKEYPTVAAAARAYGFDPVLATSRVQTHGWSVEEAIELVPKKKWERDGTVITVGGVTYRSIREAAKAHGLPAHVVGSRVRNYGWTYEEALGIKPRKKWLRQKRKPVG